MEPGVPQPPGSSFARNARISGAGSPRAHFAARVPSCFVHNGASRRQTEWEFAMDGNVFRF
jgi:hypothetical protein